MSNGINQRQNEENSILSLAAQRQLYNEAKSVGGVVTLFAIFLPFMLSIVQIFVKNNSILSTVAYISSIVSLFIGIVFENFIEKKKKRAAIIQQQFDTYVYQMPWNKRLFGAEKNLSAEIAEKSEKLFSNPAEKPKLYDWYSVIADKLPLEKGILFCQKENICWDAGLRKRYRNVSIILTVAMSCFVIAIGIIKNESVQLLIYRMAFVAPILYWLYETAKNLNYDIRRLNKLYGELSGYDAKSMDDLQDIQKDIMEHRGTCRFVPNWFYEKFKSKDEVTIQKTAEIEERNCRNL